LRRSVVIWATLSHDTRPTWLPGTRQLLGYFGDNRLFLI